MKKSRYGKLSIIFILIATLICCAATAVFGLSSKDTEGGTASAQEVSISAPEVTASTTADTRSTALAQAWTGLIQSILNDPEEGATYDFYLDEDWLATENQNREGGHNGFSAPLYLTEDPVGFENGSIVIPAGMDISLNLQGHKLDAQGYTSPAIIVRGTLTIWGDGGSITGVHDSANEAVNAVLVDGGSLEIHDCNITGNGLYDDYTSSAGRGVYVDNGTLTMSGSTISNNIGNLSGNGVYLANGSTFTMYSGEISGNGTVSAPTQPVYGGGVYVDSTSTFEMYDGKISSNIIHSGTIAADGGGVYNLGTFTMHSGEISGNNTTCGANTYYGGGGVYNKGSFTMKGGKITGNKASGPMQSGAGVRNSGTFTLEDGEISGNIFNTGYGRGIGVYSIDTFIMKGGLISGNTIPSSGSIYGAGVYISNRFEMSGGEISGHNVSDIQDIRGTVYVDGSSTVATISGGSIINNTLQGDGGGIYVVNGAAVTISGTAEIVGNTASLYTNGSVKNGGNGGGIYADSNTILNINGGLIASNSTATDSSSYYGGGIYFIGDTLNFYGGTIENNVSVTGGGVYFAGSKFNMGGNAVLSGNSANRGAGVNVNGGDFKLEAGKISGNTISGTVYGILVSHGSAVYVSGGTFTMSGGEISDNEGQVGTVSVTSGSTFDFTGGTIIGNHVAFRGSGIYVIGNSAVNMSGTATIEDNTSDKEAAVYLSGATFTMTGGSVTGNTQKSTSSIGGTIYVGSSSALNVSGGTISDNVTYGVGGGGVYVNGGTLTLSGTAEITGNYCVVNDSATVYGGGVYVNGGTFTMNGGKIYNNGASTDHLNGAGVYVKSGATFEMTDGVISDGEAEVGGGVYCEGTFNLSGGEITGNTAIAGGGVFMDEVSSDGAFTMTGGVISNNTATEEGGGGILSAGVFNLSGGEIKGNRATGSLGFGGGVYMASLGKFTMSGNAIISDNTAYEGGGVYTEYESTVTGGRIIGNKAQVIGGFAAWYHVQLQGNPYIYGNTYLDGTDASNLGLYGSYKIKVTGAITNARIGVMGNGVITDGFTSAGNVAAAVNNFAPDIEGTTLALNNGEIEIQVDLEKLWNDAVTASSETNQVVFTLPCNWTATNGSFGTGVGFKNGAIYLPAGKNILFRPNGHTVNRNLSAKTTDGSVFIVEGRLEFSDEAFSVRGGNTEKGGGFLVKNGGALLGGGTVSSSTAEYGGGIYAEAGATVSGNWTISGTTASVNGGGLYIEGGTASFGTLKISSATATGDGGAIYVKNGAVTVDSLQLSNNSCAGKNGGGLYIEDGSFELNGGRIERNKSGNGAGVYMAGGTFTMNGGIIVNNAATSSGGGIYLADGTFNMNAGTVGYLISTTSSSSIMNGGFANYNQAVEGGGVFVKGGTFNINDGTISCNTASECGGGIFIDGGAVNMYGGHVGRAGTWNEAPEGAGVYVLGGTFNMEGGEIYKNYGTTSGAGVYVSASGTFDFAGGLIKGNRVIDADKNVVKGSGITVYGGTVNMSGNAEITGQYGAVYVYSGTFNMNGGSMHDNSSDYDGGAINVGTDGTFVMTNGEIYNNTAKQGKNGGAIYTQGTVLIKGGSIHDNYNYVGGAIVVGGGTFTMTGGEIYGNNGMAGAGGAMRVEDGAVEITGGEIRNNVTMARGGAVFVLGGSFTFGGTASMTGNRTTSATYGDGSAIASQGNASVTISGGNISNNTAAYQGGAIYMDGGDFTMSGGVISDNGAKYLGGVYLQNINKFVMSGGRISGNTSEDGNVSGLSVNAADGLISDGLISGNLGGVALSGNFSMTGGTISDNNGNYPFKGGLTVGGTLTISGAASITNNSSEFGGVYISENGSLTMNGGVISGNTASDLGGGVYVGTDASFTMTDGVISNNTAKIGGGVYGYTGAAVTLTGGRIINNTASVEGGGVFVCGAATTSDKAPAFTMTGGEVSGNTAPENAGVYIESAKNGYGANVAMEGKPVIKDNLTTNDEKSNLIIDGKGTHVINVNGKFLAGAEVGISALGRFTYGLHHDNADAVDYFIPDTFGSEVKIENYELVIAVDWEAAWNKAVTESSETNTVTFTLLEDWYASIDSSFETSFGTGIGFKDGALYVPQGKSIILDLKSFTINRNKPTLSADGSVFRVAGELVITSDINDNTDLGKIVGGNAEKGGAIYVEDGGTVTLKHGVLGTQTTPNAANQGGAVYVGAGATLNIESGYIEYNTATDGAAIYVDGGTVEISGGKIRHNEATDGAALYVNDGTAILNDGCDITDNTAVNGTVYVAGGVAEIGNYVYNNTATLGGGVYVAGGNVTSSGVISYNSAEKGAGVYVAGGEYVMDGGSVNTNKNALSGGGVYVESGTFTLKSGEIKENCTSISNGSWTSVADKGAGVYVAGGTFNMEGGSIVNNAAKYYGGGVYVEGGLFHMTDGTLDNNRTLTGYGTYLNYVYGAGAVHVAGGSFVMDGGNITNTVTYSGASVQIAEGATFTMNGGAISKSKMDYNSSSDSETKNGGGVLVFGTLEMNGGEISSCDAGSNGNGGGVYVGKNATFTMNGGLISGNKAGNGAGVFDNGQFTMTDGEISGNSISSTNGTGGGIFAGMATIRGGKINNNTAKNGGGAIFLGGGVLTVYDGEMKGNTANGYGGAIYVYNHTAAFIAGGTFSGNSVTENDGGAIYVYGDLYLMGGTITGNSAKKSGGGIAHQDGKLSISGAPQVYDNFVNGETNNVQSVNDSIINIKGALKGTNGVAYIGITASEGTVVTVGFGANAGASDVPSTYFFSDSSACSIKTSGSGSSREVLIGGKVQKIALSWQYSEDGNAWIAVDSPNASVVWTGGTYTVRAINASTGAQVAFKSAEDASGNAVTSFSDIGVYKFIIENVADGVEGAYLNPVLTFEITKAEVEWQYTTDGTNWKELDFNSVDYTGLTYKFRAFYNGREVLAFADAAKNAGSYQFKVNESLYSNPTLDFKIEKRKVKVEWNFTGSTLNGGLNVWTYDGYAHAPVAYLSGISSEQAGILDLDFSYTCVDRLGNTSSYTAAQAKAGEYKVTVALLNPDDAKNIILSNETVTYNIEAIALSLVWKDGNGVQAGEFTFDFDGNAHSLNAVLSGVLSGEDINLLIGYTQGGRDVTAPVSVGTYTATAKLPSSCLNYYLDKTYTCQIVIKQTGVTVEWSGNADKNGAFVWTYNGQAKAPSVRIVNPLDGSEIKNYTVEYAPVDTSGNVGTYTSAKPVDAGKYSMRISYKDGNFTLKDTEKVYEIEKLGVTLSWTGGELDDGVIRWAYDGAAHDITPVVKGLEIWTASGVIGTLEVERTDGLTGGITAVGSATATAALKNTAFNANFYITNSTSQDYEVYKRVIDSITWKDSFGNTFGMTDAPEYDHGKITGANGPAYTATVPDYTAANGTLSLTVTYSATFGGTWAVDETNGYKAYAKLSAADFINYEFADGKDTAELTFYIMEVSESKQDITVTWVVFINAADYVTLQDYIDNHGGFVYNGNVQSPTPIYIKDAATGSYEKLALNPNSIGADAKNYVARLMPSSIYNIPASQFTCPYEIKPLSVEIKWQDGETDSGKTFSYTYDNTEKKPYAYAQDANGNVYNTVTVKGYVNAGNHTATATVSSNFTISTGATQSYVINKLALATSLINWTFGGASGNDTDGWYWVFDGNEHAPTAQIVLNSLGVTLDLTVTGKTSVTGTHYAYAVLDGSNPFHANFTLSGEAQRVFNIIQVAAGTVVWEDNDGHSSVNGADKLTLIYNGEAQAPKAYFMKDATTKVYLTVNGKMTNVGTYTAFVTDDFDFGKDASGNKIVPKCVYEIKPMELEVQWSNTTLTYNGKAQSPTATVADATLADGTVFTLAAGTDYTVSSFTDAGDYKAKITFVNGNYTFKQNTGETDFTVEKIKLGATEAEWTANGASINTSGGWFWQYDEASHNPELSLKSPYLLDGDQVTFVFGYTGATANAGTHTATAFVKSATWRGVDVTANFAVDGALDSKDYEITAFEITVRWDFTGASGNDTDGWFWSYDGAEHGPKAFYTDWTGVEKQLTVYGKQTNARTAPYKATVSAPENCKFAAGAITEREYSVKQASIEVIWDFAAAGASGNDTDGWYWTYDGNKHAPKAFIKVTAQDGTVTKGNPLAVTGDTANAGTHTAVAAQNDGNYTITAGATQTFTIRELEVYVQWYGETGSTTDKFEWTYTGGVIAPTAKLADGSGNLILDGNGKEISVQVTGGMTDVSANAYTAQAVDSFANYKFANAQTSSHTFKILPKSLADNGFKWTANGAQVSSDGLTFTYSFNEEAQFPVPQCNGGIGFITTIVKVKSGVETPVSSIKDAGEYKITVKSSSANYVVPDSLKTVNVVIKACEVEVVWSEDKITFNGKNQVPAAYYENAKGVKISLEGSIKVFDESGNPLTEYKNAGKYVAKAELSGTDGNYVLKTTTVEKTYEIAKKLLPVSWKWDGFTDKALTYDGNGHAPVGIPSFTGTTIPQITVYFVITDKDGTALADNTKAVNAGTYKITYKLNGADKDNYGFENGEETFTIKKAALTVVAEDKEVTYGANAPAYGATFTGFVTADAGKEAQLEADGVLSQWLICDYVNTTVPGTYVIAIDKSWLADELTNYAITATNGKLTVKPAAGVLVWKGDTANGADFTYSGNACQPQAYYYTDAAQTNPISLTVTVYKTRADAEAGNNPVTAIDAGVYFAKATGGDGTHTFGNAVQEFNVNKLEIVITVNDLSFTYGEVTETNISAHLVENSGWTYGDKLPADNDDLKIKLSTNDASAYAGTFLNAGVYEITGSWNADNDATLANNYTVTFKYADGAAHGKLEVKKADITVNIEENEDGYNYVEGFITRGGIYHVDDLKDLITFQGDKTAKPVINYSATPYKFGEGVDDGQWSTEVPFISAEGLWVVNYTIELANHNTKEGKLLISLVSDEFRIVLKYDGVYTVVYGEELPADLAKALFDKGVVSVDENQSAYTTEQFLAHATAAIYGEDGSLLTGRIPAGRYEVRFTLDNTQYRIDGVDEEKSFEVTKRNLDVNWGELEFKFDDEKHMPVISITDWTDPDGASITLTEGENVVTIGGEPVKVTVSVEGDLTKEGGHSVLISVESDNYTVNAKDANRAVSIMGEGAGEASEGGLPAWLLWTIIAAAVVLLAIIIALAVIIKKRKAQADSDGFYEDAPLEEQ